MTNLSAANGNSEIKESPDNDDKKSSAMASPLNADSATAGSRTVLVFGESSSSSPQEDNQNKKNPTSFCAVRRCAGFFEEPIIFFGLKDFEKFSEFIVQQQPQESTVPLVLTYKVFDSLIKAYK